MIQYAYPSSPSFLPQRCPCCTSDWGGIPAVIVVTNENIPVAQRTAPGCRGVWLGVCKIFTSPKKPTFKISPLLPIFTPLSIPKHLTTAMFSARTAFSAVQRRAFSVSAQQVCPASPPLNPYLLHLSSAVLTAVETELQGHRSRCRRRNWTAFVPPLEAQQACL